MRFFEALLQRLALEDQLAFAVPRRALQDRIEAAGSAGVHDQHAVEVAVRLVEVPAGGKPAALNAGVAVATGEILVLADARQVFSDLTAEGAARKTAAADWHCLALAHLGASKHDAALAAKFGDSIERIYRRADTFIAEVLEHLDGPRLSSLIRRYGPLQEQQYLPLAIDVAAALAELGAKVTLVSGPVSLSAPPGVERVWVETAREMLAACEAALPADIAVCVAASNGGRPASRSLSWAASSAARRCRANSCSRL